MPRLVSTVNVVLARHYYELRYLGVHARSRLSSGGPDSVGSPAYPGHRWRARGVTITQLKNAIVKASASDRPSLPCATPIAVPAIHKGPRPVIAGHKTSVSIEDAFWKSLQEIAKGRDMTASDLVAAIKAERKHGNLSSAVRLFVLDHHRRRSPAASDQGAS
jgi:predicted DNA-binding ribbon-helix-helix protein